jgi:hypothetical protein
MAETNPEVLLNRIWLRFTGTQGDHEVTALLDKFYDIYAGRVTAPQHLLQNTDDRVKTPDTLMLVVEEDIDDSPQIKRYNGALRKIISASLCAVCDEDEERVYLDKVYRDVSFVRVYRT